MPSAVLAAPALALQGFNNISSTLGFNAYLVRYARDRKQVQVALDKLHEAYSADALGGLLENLAAQIRAEVLCVSRQDYQPRGASATVMISDLVHAHLDKSHLSAHTYPEHHPHNGILTLRIDIDVSTCGDVNPMAALPLLFGCLQPDVASMDFRLRGFTRDRSGEKCFQHQPIASMQAYLPETVRRDYCLGDINQPSNRLYTTRAQLARFDLERHLVDDIPDDRKDSVASLLRRELEEIR